jgi:Domain of unknown function (DUF1906)
MKRRVMKCRAVKPRSQRLVRRPGLLVVALAAAALLSACLPPPPPPPPAYTKGFDACAAPSLTTMSKWKTSSPYVNVGVYIGGANRGCAQPNLTASWVTSVWGQGWKLLPIWVGPQASCTTLGSATKLSADTTTAFFQGLAEAQAAAAAAKQLGLGWLTPIYYDMEGYTRGGPCSVSVQSFANGWVRQLNALGLRAGMYSSLCSGILDAAASVSDSTKVPLNAVWIAAWNSTPNIYGFGSPCALSDTLWSDHQRVHQYIGGHNEAYGGVTINIDTNAVDGPTG